MGRQARVSTGILTKLQAYTSSTLQLVPTILTLGLYYSDNFMGTLIVQIVSDVAKGKYGTKNELVCDLCRSVSTSNK